MTRLALFALLLYLPLLTQGGVRPPRYKRQPERQHNRAVNQWQRQARKVADQKRKERQQIARQEPRN